MGKKEEEEKKNHQTNFFLILLFDSMILPCVLLVLSMKYDRNHRTHHPAYILDSFARFVLNVFYILCLFELRRKFSTCYAHCRTLICLHIFPFARIFLFLFSLLHMYIVHRRKSTDLRVVVMLEHAAFSQINEWTLLDCVWKLLSNSNHFHLSNTHIWRFYWCSVNWFLPCLMTFFSLFLTLFLLSRWFSYLEVSLLKPVSN